MRISAGTEHGAGYATEGGRHRRMREDWSRLNPTLPPETPGRAKRHLAGGRGSRYLRLLSKPLYLLGVFSGLGGSCLCQLLFFGSLVGPALPSADDPSTAHQIVPHRPPHVPPGGYHAIVVPAGGQAVDGPPAHVAARLEEAIRLYERSPAPKPFVITTAWGTPHKPCPHDAGGFERHPASDDGAGRCCEQRLLTAAALNRHEAADNALYLTRRGVPPDAILEESASLETVGNALFTRLLHTDPRGLRTLAVVNNRFHMPRTRAVFGHVFRVPPTSEAEPEAAYELEYYEVEDHLPADVLQARLRKEAKSTPVFAEGGSWRAQTRTLRELAGWLWRENTAYATKRLLEERLPPDPEVLKSY